MPFLDTSEVVERVLAGSITVKDGLASLFDRQSGLVSLDEGDHVDYKLTVDPYTSASVGELSRDILGFSNAGGGVILIGVNNNHFACGVRVLDLRRLRDSLGPFVGTRIAYEIDVFNVTISGKTIQLAYALIPKTETSYPHLLRKDISPPSSFIRKPKYVKGTLFYRVADTVQSESPFGDVDSKARDLGFTGASPRTSTSFQIIEDRPLLRLYSQINDRFFGRRQELGTLVAEFDNPRGRGVSIGGFGGLGKTELAINIVSQLYKSGRFKFIYSASAKQTVLGATGLQQADPIFIDLRSFLLDLSGWLGISVAPSATVQVLKEACLRELNGLADKKLLIFVDNLETVIDRTLFDFLDNELPVNCWILATSRVHRLRRFLSPIELRPMDQGDDAGRLLRHELKRQGLPELSGKDISELVTKARELANHPLAIRWYAWACRRDMAQWTRTVVLGDLKQIEDFCVSSTLKTLGEESQRVLGSILAINNAPDSTMGCIQHVADVDPTDIEGVLWDLECSGMLNVTTDENGVTTYSVAPMAQRLAGDIARDKGWEADYVYRLRQFAKRSQAGRAESPLVLDLLATRPVNIRSLSKTEKEEIIRRIDRSLPSADLPNRVRLLWRKAECARHLQQIITADDTYAECAQAVLQNEQLLPADERGHILLEAATVARGRAVNKSQIERAIGYLRAAEKSDADNTRLVGMLAEFYGSVGDSKSFATYAKKAHELIALEEPDSTYAVNLALAVERGR